MSLRLSGTGGCGFAAALRAAADPVALAGDAGPGEPLSCAAGFASGRPSTASSVARRPGFTVVLLRPVGGRVDSRGVAETGSGGNSALPSTGASSEAGRETSVRRVDAAGVVLEVGNLGGRGENRAADLACTACDCVVVCGWCCGTVVGVAVWEGGERCCCVGPSGGVAACARMACADLPANAAAAALPMSCIGNLLACSSCAGVDSRTLRYSKAAWMMRAISSGNELGACVGGL